MAANQTCCNAIQDKSRSESRPEVPRSEQLPLRRPNIDIRELEDAFVIEAELPGVRASDVEITMENGVLALSGVTCPCDATSSNGRMIVREFGPTRFERTFRIPDVVDVNEVGAETRHGLLTIRLPKREQARSRKIEVVSG